MVERVVEFTTGDLSVYPLFGIFTSLGIDTRPTAFSVSSERHRDKQSLMLRARFLGCGSVSFFTFYAHLMVQIHGRVSTMAWFKRNRLTLKKMHKQLYNKTLPA